MNKNLFSAAIPGIFCILYACGNGSAPSNSEKAGSGAAAAAVNYTNECSSCHGKSGNLMMGGAKDLSKSVLSKDEVVAIISGGKGMMPGFKDKFSAQQIEELAVYAESLRK